MAYAAVVSVKQKIERLHHSSHPKILEMKPIHYRLHYLESLLEKCAHRQGCNVRFDPLEQKIEHLADKIDHLIEHAFTPPDPRRSLNLHSLEEEISDATSRFADLNLSGSQQLLHLAREIDLLMEKLKENMRNYYNMEKEVQQGTDGYAPSPTIYDFGGWKSKLVGMESEVEALMYWILKEPSPYCRIMSVVGMAGIGKTTLVRQLYHHPLLAKEFNSRCWVTIGPNYSFREFALHFLGIKGFHEKFGDDELRHHFHQVVKGRKHLVVLDDVWSSEVWMELLNMFPEEKTGSLIILISRLFDVANHETIHKKHVKLFLNDDESWSLLQMIVFTNPLEPCSYKLQKFGKEIAKNCEGLPLAILAVGRHLHVAEKTVEYWEEVSKQENLRDIIKEYYDYSILPSLALSYRMLPRRLKECFLYIGIVPNYEISVSELINLWVVEGFLGSPPQDRSLEDMAEEFLQKIVSQSVVLVRKYSSRPGRIKICRIHFIFRNLCIAEAQNEKFCYVMRKYAYSFPMGTNEQQRLCVHSSSVLSIKEVHSTMKSISSVRSLLCLGPQHQYPLRPHFNFNLLKVLNALRIRFHEFPHQVLKLVRLKYLAITYDGKIPESISQLRNLEILIVGRHQSIISIDAPIYLPMEIWTLKWLRHLQCTGISLPDPCKWMDDDDNRIILEHLITLSNINARCCSPGILARVPNLKKLGIRIELAPDKDEFFTILENIFALQCLESFKCVVLGLSSQRIDFHFSEFPPSLRKLTLSGCKLPWDKMTIIGSLPNLEILKLRCRAFQGPYWDPVEGEFLHLRVLLLEDLDIVWWNCDNIHYPVIERLMIRHCYKLSEIPLGIGDVSTLETIELDDCSSALVSSVKEIEEDQRALGNEGLQIRINCSWEDKKKDRSEIAPKMNRLNSF